VVRNNAGLILLTEPGVYAEYKALPIPIGTASGNNAYIERFNRIYREEVLDLYLFDTLAEAGAITETWLEEYNAIQPYDALGGLTPYKYAAEVAFSRKLYF
jgi:transposase InsO family protein